LFKRLWWLQDEAGDGTAGDASGGGVADAGTTNIGGGSNEPAASANPDAAASNSGTEAGAGQPQSPQGQEPAPPKTAYEAVQRAMSKQRDDAAAAAQPQQQPAAQQQPGEQPQGQQQPAEQPGQQPKQGGEPAKDANTRIRELNGRVKALEPKAAYWDQLANWAHGNGLTSQDVTTGLELMRLVRVDPIAARRLLDPIVDRVNRFVGEVLPPDLQEKVEAGRLDEETARELAQQRAGTELRTQRDREEQQQRQLQEEQQRVERHANAVGDAVKRWEGAWAGSDPDYRVKQPHVSRAISHLMMTEGVPPTIEAALDLCVRAKKQVEQDLQSFVPRPQEQRGPTGGAAPRSTTAPKSSIEAARRGLSAAA
jgi:hypothetical protein